MLQGENDLKSSEMNKLLINVFLNLIDFYQKEIEQQEGNETGSHTVYGDVFSPYIRDCIETNNVDEIIKIFDFIEFVLSKNDEYANEVISFSVLESIDFQLKKNRYLSIYIGENTISILQGF